METTKVSKKLLNRLPGYLNHLKTLPQEAENVSASAIARALGLGEVQVRKDLAKISHTGRRRTGRSLDEVIRAGWAVGVGWQDGRPFQGPCHIRMNLALPFERVKEAFARLDEYVFTD